MENSLASGVASAMEEEVDSFGKCVTIDVAPPSKQKEKAASLKLDMPKVAHDSSKDSVTVFVSNLPYSMDEPEVKLRPLFEVCGEVVQIRPVFSNRGDFRGYCYVEFKEEKSAQQALELDRKTVEGRPMFVSPCVDKSKNPDFKVCFGEKGAFKGGCQMDGAQCLEPTQDHVQGLLRSLCVRLLGSAALSLLLVWWWMYLVCGKMTAFPRLLKSMARATLPVLSAWLFFWSFYRDGVSGGFVI